MGATISDRERRNLALLGFIAAAVELVYLSGMVIPFYLPRFYAVPLLDLGKLTAYSTFDGFRYLAVVATLCGMYYGAFRLVSSSTLPRVMASTQYRRSLLVLILAGGAGFAVTLGLAYPYAAVDIFDYVFHARIIAQYHGNPFLQAPSEFANDPLLPYVAWRDLPFTYGPLWAYLGAALGMLGGANLLANLLLFKGLAIAAYLAILPLAYSILGRLAPEYRAAGLLLFAWNPLVLTETAGNGHNDAIMMALVLAALRLSLASDIRRRGLSLTVLTASALIKFVSGLLWPLLVVALWRGAPRGSRIKALAPGALGAVILVILSYWPFWAGPATLAVQRRDELFTASIPTIVKMALERAFGMADVRFVGTLFLAAFACYVLREAWDLAPGHAALANAVYRAVLCYLLFASLWFQPWYLVWLVALAAVCPRLDVAYLTMLFSGSAMMNYFVFDYLWFWIPDALDEFGIQIVAVVAIYAMPFIFCAYRQIRRPVPAGSEH